MQVAQFKRQTFTDIVQDIGKCRKMFKKEIYPFHQRRGSTFSGNVSLGISRATSYIA